ncbi:MAG TPA: aldehyde dehydrogenase [Solirubrobacteraceae bacterium]|jgi:acyl-CoA reductase-like NAD-dependent aldehyde dehydrogenase|nr:aldehyde dehydrogenase [Solirubrobacteraceae bacterium]
MSVGAERRGGARADVEGVSVPVDHYIDGRRIASAERFEVRSPIDWERWKLADVAAGGASEVDHAVAAARRAFPGWAALGPDGRHQILSRLADAIDAAVPNLAKVETVDNGSLYEAMHLRVLPRAANNVRFFADFARDRLGEPERTLHGGERNRVRYDPCGVVAVSTPWNAPFMLATWRVGPALAAGNTVVLKPPEWAPLTCSLLGDLAEEAGVPPGVLNIVHGNGVEAGAPLTGHPDVDRVAFTGSPATARTVYRDAAANLTPVSFELGGKSPFIVFEDADLDAATATAAYQYDNSGQVCLAGTRLLVQRSVLDEFMTRFTARVGEIRVGDPREPTTTYGPLIHPVALERVTGHVERTLAAGARLAFGGQSLGGLYYPPTLFTDVPREAEILQREVFGPVLTLQRFADEEEAIRLANGTDYGLAATIYTGSESRAQRVGAAVVAGTVWVNCFYVRDLETPFGGARESGIGREGGRHSFDFYCDVKTVCERTSLFTAK